MVLLGHDEVLGIHRLAQYYRVHDLSRKRAVKTGKLMLYKPIAIAIYHS